MSSFEQTFPEEIATLRDFRRAAVLAFNRFL